MNSQELNSHMYDFFDQLTRLLDRNLFHFSHHLTWPALNTVHTKDIYMENWDNDTVIIEHIEQGQYRETEAPGPQTLYNFEVQLCKIAISSHPPISIHTMTEMNPTENPLTPEQILENQIMTLKQNLSESYNSFSRSWANITGLGSTINAHAKLINEHKAIIMKLKTQQNELIV